jgi:DNA-binding NarL/FixJ family response regulator
VRIVIGEDSTLFREGLASLLTDLDHDIVARAADAPALDSAVDLHPCDLVIVDVRMPPDNTDDGARAARRIRQKHPRLGILLLSQHIETTHSVELVASGSFGYLLKDRVLDVDDFVDALTRVANGGSALDPEVVTRLVAANRDADPLKSLTPRERDVLALMAEGRTNAGIARRLWLTPRTVEAHVSNIMTKFGLIETTEDHRRVRAVLTYLKAHPPSHFRYQLRDGM